MTTMTAKKTSEAPVDTYKPRPLADALADPDYTTEVEDRQPDQIEDYHETHPTLVVHPQIEKTVEEQAERLSDGDAVR